ncbi:unnamed protein product [Parnassius apollo]|uniref:(apollo) hypothetical protein n=1 Tax=Parnassius apollo TaxID=110799 RepID=A0A8S3W7S3_PARAO|nr:unnamed protein product [Parnassius apollo]
MKIILALYCALVWTIFTKINKAYSLNILGVFPYEGKSHFFVFETYLKELARKGHNVTVISYFPQNEPIKNYHDISLAGKLKILEEVFPIKRSYWTIIQIPIFVVNSGTQNCKTLLEDKNVQNLWKAKSKFDVVVTEQFNSDCSLGLAYALNAPVVGLTSHALVPWHFSRFGVPFNPSYVSFMLLNGGTKPTLYQRLERTIVDTYLRIIYKYFSQRVDQSTLAQYFNNIPPLEVLGRNIKFLLLYTHFVHFGSNLLPQNVIEVGGYHLKNSKQLPEDLRKFIEGSPHGVIYISFGSMLKAASMPRDKIDSILSALAELPQRIIWKWDEKTLPRNPKNIYLSNWLPQNDILAHPNVVAFYSHCGLLGTTEALYHGVPVLAMPIFGDQPANAAAVEESGLGVQIELKDITKESLLKKFKTILTPEFRAKVKSLSQAWLDRPTSAMETAVHWTEFAARYPNFTFRSAAADVPLYQYLCLDILCVLLGIPAVIMLIILTCHLNCNRKFKQSTGNKKTSKNE